MNRQTISVGPDGTAIEGYLEGEGPPILFLHPGMDDGRSWSRVTSRLSDRFRTLRLHRRTYRLDLDVEPATSLSAEIADVLAVADAQGTPVLLVGHSSGGVVALEALLAAPEKFAGAVIYEAPVPVDGPLGGEALAQARTALAARGPGPAIRIFMREIVRYPAWLSWVIGVLVGAVPALARRVPRQLVDCEAIDRNGIRLEAYARIGVPVLLLAGDRSPSHLAKRSNALQAVIPQARSSWLAGQEHTANRRAPDQVARLIAEYATGVLAVEPRSG